jgi:hypothetical protein
LGDDAVSTLAGSIFTSLDVLDLNGDCLDGEVESTVDDSSGDGTFADGPRDIIFLELDWQRMNERMWFWRCNR